VEQPGQITRVLPEEESLFAHHVTVEIHVHRHGHRPQTHRPEEGRVRPAHLMTVEVEIRPPVQGVQPPLIVYPPGKFHSVIRQLLEFLQIFIAVGGVADDD